jgi:hypothetical protein
MMNGKMARNNENAIELDLVVRLSFFVSSYINFPMSNRGMPDDPGNGYLFVQSTSFFALG